MKNNNNKKKSYSSKKIFVNKSIENSPKNGIIIFNLKCPICNKICLININKEQLSISFKCNNNNCNYYNKYKYDIICNKSCSNIIDPYLNKSETICPKHPTLKFYSYCYDCKKNICKQCRKEHAQHSQIGLNEKKPKDNEIFINRIKIREKFEKFNKTINDIIKWKKEFENGINSFITVMKNIYTLENFIIMNYDKNNYQNYNYIENYNYFKTFNYKNQELDEFLQTSDWKEKGKILIEAIINIKNIVDNNNEEISNYIIHKKNENNNLSPIINKKGTKNIKKEINNINLNYFKYNYLLTIEQNQNLEQKINKEYNLKSFTFNNQNLQNSGLKLKNIDNNINQDIITNANDINEINEDNNTKNDNNDILNKGMLESEDDKYTKNSKIIINEDENKQEENENIIEFKNEKEDNDMIKSIEFMNKNRLLICTSRTITIYKINSLYGIDVDYFIQFSENKIKYGRQLSNGNLAICFSDVINIIKIIEGESSIINNYLIIQKIEPKYNIFSINKIIEIKHKNYLISCNNKYITIYQKFSSNQLYNEIDNIKIIGEVKCIENINEKFFAAVNPEKEIITFYDTEDFQDNNFIISNIQCCYGRYNIVNVEKYNCIFVAGIYRIYFISTEKFEIINHLEIDEWITCIDYDYLNDCLICGSYKKNIANDIKNYNLIIFSIEKDNSENVSEKSEFIEIKRRNNIHQNNIMIIRYIKDGYIITGSNDKKFKIWK